MYWVGIRQKYRCSAHAKRPQYGNCCTGAFGLFWVGSSFWQRSAICCWSVWQHQAFHWVGVQWEAASFQHWIYAASRIWNVQFWNLFTDFLCKLLQALCTPKHDEFSLYYITLQIPVNFLQDAFFILFFRVSNHFSILPFVCGWFLLEVQKSIPLLLSSCSNKLWVILISCSSCCCRTVFLYHLIL